MEVKFVKRAVQKRKNPYKSVTPITIAIPKHLQEAIKYFPRKSLNCFKEGTATGTDWYNLTFRTKIGLDLAVAIYTEDSWEPMKEVHEVCLNLYREYKKTNKWTITESQFEIISSGLDAVDQIQDQTTRREQLEVFKNSDLYVKKLMEKANKGEDI